jgi:hypothetical protein
MATVVVEVKKIEVVNWSKSVGMKRSFRLFFISHNLYLTEIQNRWLLWKDFKQTKACSVRPVIVYCSLLGLFICFVDANCVIDITLVFKGTELEFFMNWSLSC